MNDYTNSQTRGGPMLPAKKTEEYRIAASQLGQQMYFQRYGERPVTVHVVVSTVPEKVWHISPEMVKYVRRFPRNQMVFVWVTPEEKAITGWLYHSEVEERMKKAHHDGFDIKGPFTSMEDFSA